MTDDSAWQEGRSSRVRRLIWLTGQRSRAAQLRDSGCVPGTGADVDLMPPSIATHAITAYTDPGELVLDPDCGAGTVLTAALRVDRSALGLTTDPRWWTTARANVIDAKRQGAWRDGSVFDASPEALAAVRAAGLAGGVGLVLTALRTATRDLDSAIEDLAATLSHCRPLLRSGGHVVITARPRRRPDGSLADLTTALITAVTSADLVAVDRCVALTAELRGGRLITHTAFAERLATRSGADGTPIALSAHHEVLVFRAAADVDATTSVLRRPRPRALPPASIDVEDLVGTRAA